jgi:hypothetical protein
MTMTLIGYGQYQYPVKNSPALVSWPILGIALQKSYMSFYNNAHGDGAPFTCAYADRLGRARVSAKGVVTFTNIGDVSLQVFGEMVTAIAAGLESGQMVAR